MSKIFIVSAQVAEDPKTFLQEPRYRKATRAMVMANRSVEKTLESLPREVVLQNCGFILGSCHGELEVTMNFLKTMSETGVARPILFQNSLHNSTTGFVSMSLKSNGPLLTVSNLHFTGEDALETAVCLLKSQSCDFCLVTTVEARVPELVEGLQETKLRSQYIGEGSGTVLLCNAHGLATLDRQPLAELLSVRCVRGEKENFIESTNYYESNAVERLALGLQTNETSLKLIKPDGSYSQIQWR
jgi:3-oxoacyl-(acyl-carrier-protein) synthase